MRRTTGLAAGTAALLLAAGAARAGGPMVQGAGPSDARPGDCYEKVRVEEVWQTTPERQLVAPEHVEHRLVPAEYTWRDRQVVVRPARQEHYTVPATFRTVLETVVVRPQSFRTEVIPAVYEAVPRQVLVREARAVWKPAYSQPAYGDCAPRGCGGGGWPQQQTQVTPTGEVLCLVYEPAVYRTVVEQVMREPERTVQVPVPAETRQVARQVVDRPAYDAVHDIPAEYGVEPEQVLVRPARDEAYTVPAVYRTVEGRRLVSPARFEWRHSACKPPPPEPAPPPPPPPAPPMVAEPLPCHTGACAPAPRAMAPPPPGAVAPPPRMADRGPPPRRRMEGPPPRMETAAGGRPGTAVLERQLAGRGYYRGPVDGLNTPQLQDALRRFQRDKGLAADGLLTRETADALNR